MEADSVVFTGCNACNANGGKEKREEKLRERERESARAKQSVVVFVMRVLVKVEETEQYNVGMLRRWENKDGE